MARKQTVALTLLLVACAAAYSAASRGSGGPARTAATPASPAAMLAAAGTVEPISEEIDVGSELTGKLERVLVEEGARVRAGEVVAMIASRDYQAHLASSRATLDDQAAALRRLVNGARVQERDEARAAVEEADAVVTAALAARNRRRELLVQRAISPEEADRAEEAWSVAVAKRRAAAERYALIDAGARGGRSGAGRGRCGHRACGGRRRGGLSGEDVHSIANRWRRAAPAPPGRRNGDQLGDRSGRDYRRHLTAARARRSRRARRGGGANRPAGAGPCRCVPDQSFSGVITRVGEALGKKRIRTELPTERMDTKVLEVLVELEAGVALRPGLRVDVFIER